MSYTHVNHGHFSYEIDTESETCHTQSSIRQSIQLSSNGKHNAQPNNEFHMDIHTDDTAQSPWNLLCARDCAFTDSISAGGTTKTTREMTETTDYSKRNTSSEFTHSSDTKTNHTTQSEPPKMSKRYRYIQERCQKFEDDLSRRPICGPRISSTNESILECCVMPKDTKHQRYTAAAPLHYARSDNQSTTRLLHAMQINQTIRTRTSRGHTRQR